MIPARSFQFYDATLATLSQHVVNGYKKKDIAALITVAQLNHDIHNVQLFQSIFKYLTTLIKSNSVNEKNLYGVLVASRCIPFISTCANANLQYGDLLKQADIFYNSNKIPRLAYEAMLES